MVTIEQIKRFKQVKERFDALDPAKQVRVLKAMDANKKVEAMNRVQQHRLLFRFLYDPTKTDEVIKRVENA